MPMTEAFLVSHDGGKYQNVRAAIIFHRPTIDLGLDLDPGFPFSFPDLHLDVGMFWCIGLDLNLGVTFFFFEGGCRSTRSRVGDLDLDLDSSLLES